jgi:RNA polymerase sigma factor (TIGR02999 family)
MDDVIRTIADTKIDGAEAAQRLLPLVYDELRRLAASWLSHEKPGQTLQPTALVHEAYLRLVGSDPDKVWDGRGHFFAAAALAMRRILVERARRRSRLRHGGGHDRVQFDLDDLISPGPLPDERLLALDMALDRFAAEEPEKAQFVQLRFFAGLTLEQAAEVQGISRATAARYWKYARAWLYDAIGPDSPGESTPDRGEPPRP